MSLPRLIATDLDGTFLSPDSTISPTNLAAIERAQDAGIPVMFATGRPPTWLHVIDDVTLADSRVVAANGAVLIDVATRNVLEDHPIRPAVAAEVADELRAAIDGVAFAAQYSESFGHEDGFMTEIPPQMRGDIHVGELPDLLHADRVIKLLVRHTRMGAVELAERASAVIGQRLTVTFSMSKDYGLLELSAPGITKAHMLSRLAASLGIDAADVAAFGDMPNDYAMLAWAGRPHVMGDAHPQLAGLDATRIGTNAEDAVGRTILSWFDD